MLRPRWSPALAFLLLAACGEATDRPAPAVPVVVTPLPETTALLVASAPAPEPVPPVVELPATSGCVLEGAWRGRTGLTDLLLRGGGPAFARIQGGQARLRFPIGPRPATQGLDVEADGIAVSGHVDADAADLRATKPFWLSGLALPTVSTRFHWIEAADGELTVTTEAPQALEVLGGPLTAKRPCADISTDGPSFSTEAAIDGIAGAKPKQFVAGHLIDISLEPGGKPVAQANPTKDTGHVDVLETRGKNARISWYTGTLYVIGWVAAGELRSPLPGTGYGSGSGRLGGHRARSPVRKVVCAADVRLVVEAGGERAVAGWLRGGTTIELLYPTGDLTPIVVRSGKIYPAEGASWLATNAELDRCAPAP